MNKKLFLSLFLTLTLSATFAQNADLKYYFDYVNGLLFEGYAIAKYMSNILDEENVSGTLDHRIEVFFESFNNGLTDSELNEDYTSTPVSKLTKNNKWLLDKALNEWERERGEAYMVACADRPDSTSALQIVVGITSPEDYEYRAWLLETK